MVNFRPFLSNPSQYYGTAAEAPAAKAPAPAPEVVAPAEPPKPA